jgi:hypothetical protein
MGEALSPRRLSLSYIRVIKRPIAARWPKREMTHATVQLHCRSLERYKAQPEVAAIGAV